MIDQPNEDEQSKDGGLDKARTLAAELEGTKLVETEHPPELTARHKIDRMLTPEGKQELRARNAKELDSPELAAIRSLIEKDAQVSADYYADRIDYDTYQAEAQPLRDQIYAPQLRDARERYTMLASEQAELDRDRVGLYKKHANELLANILEDAPNGDAVNQSHLFVDDDRLKLLQRTTDYGERTLLLDTDTTTRIPRGMFVGAASFESWDGRNPANFKDGRLSKEVIEDYASRTTQPPHVEAMSGYLLPDGRVYFSSENSHRVAAALRRTDEHIEFKGRIYLNVIDDDRGRL